MYLIFFPVIIALHIFESHMFVTLKGVSSQNIFIESIKDELGRTVSQVAQIVNYLSQQLSP